MIFASFQNLMQMRKLKTLQSLNPTLSNNLYPSIQMLNGCNKQCVGCLHSANTDSYKIEYDIFREKYIGDLIRISGSYNLKYQFVTGGEPTIWDSEDNDITDVLADLFELNLIGSIYMPTNGRKFEDIDYTRDFAKKVSARISRNITVGMSISKHQDNLGESGYEAADNLVRVSNEPGMKINPIFLVNLSTDDDTDIRLKKIYPGVFQKVTPLAPFGDASEMDDLAPSLCLTGKNKDALGSFYPYYKQDVINRLKISDREFNRLPNAEIINRLSLHTYCGMSPFVNEKWHYCLTFKDDPRFDLCDVGEMREGTIPDFLDNAGLLNCIRAEGLIKGVNEHKDELTPETRDKLDELYSPSSKVSIAFRGCMICKAMYDIGVVKELIDGHSDCKR